MKRSKVPFLFQAMIDWCAANGQTPMLSFDVRVPGVQVPDEVLQPDQPTVTFDISPQAIRDLEVTDDWVRFRAAFACGIAWVALPTTSLLDLFAEEDADGLSFAVLRDVDALRGVSTDQEETTSTTSGRQVGHLHVIK